MKDSHLLLLLGGAALLYYFYTKNSGGTSNQLIGQVPTQPGATTQGQNLAQNIGNTANNLLTSGVNAVQNLVTSGAQNISSGINQLTETNYTPQQTTTATS